MATLNFSLPINMFHPAIFYGWVDSYNNSNITITDGYYTGTYDGAFTYNANGLSGGTVTGYHFYEGGALSATVTNGNANALTVYNYLSAGNASGLYNYILRFDDIMFGSASADGLSGYIGNDTIYGNSGNDTLSGGPGNDILNGGAGIDTAIFSGIRSAYTISSTATGYTVTGGNDGAETLTNIERLQFSDKKIAIDINGFTGQAFRLYQAAFDRTPDQQGLGYWINQMDNGMSLQDVAKSFIASQEFANLYGSHPTNTSFINKLYNHVLDRQPDIGGQTYWENQLTSQSQSQSEVLLGFSESTENQNNVIGLIGVGIELP